METIDGNMLIDWQLSYPDKKASLLNSSTVLRPVFADLGELDGVIGNHYFVKRELIGNGGFSKVYLGKIV